MRVRLAAAISDSSSAASESMPLPPSPRAIDIIAASNYASGLVNQERFKEAKALLRKPMRVARRVLGESHDLTLRMRKIYARALYEDPGATLDDLREAVTTLEEIVPTTRRGFGGAHPLTTGIEDALGKSRAKLRARETPSA